MSESIPITPEQYNLPAKLDIKQVELPEGYALPTGLSLIDKPYIVAEAMDLHISMFETEEAMVDYLRDKVDSDEALYLKVGIFKGDRFYTTKGPVKYLKIGDKNILLSKAEESQEIDESGSLNINEHLVFANPNDDNPV